MQAINWVTANYLALMKIAGLVYALACAIVALLPQGASKNAFVAVLEFVSMLAHRDSPGTLKFPFTSARTNRARPTRVPPLPTILMLALGLFSCAGSTTSVGGTISLTPNGTWTAGINVGISIAREELPQIKRLVDARPDIAASVKTQIDHGFDVAADALPLAQTAFNAYAQTPTTPNLCLAHFYLEQALTGALQSMALVNDLGASVTAAEVAGANVAIGSLAAIIDMIYPACAASGPPTRHQSAQERVHAALGAH